MDGLKAVPFKEEGRGRGAALSARQGSRYAGTVASANVVGFQRWEMEVSIDCCSRSFRKPSERCRPSTVDEFLRANCGIRTGGGNLEASGSVLLDWRTRQLDARFVGGGNEPAEVK